MNFELSVRKMLSKLPEDESGPVEYFLTGPDGPIGLNEYIGRKIEVSFLSQINCINCNRKIKKTFQNGYCFPCSQKLAECDLCIVRPELCHFKAGTCRDKAWAENHCFIDHYLYLSNTSGPKVGITRHTQIPTRWVDQGAHQGLIIGIVGNRHQSGIIEHGLKSFINDKTSWQKMLKGPGKILDLESIRDELFEQAGAVLDDVEDEASGIWPESRVELLTEEKSRQISYPVVEYPKKVKSFDLLKLNPVEGTLLGIKGQYLIFDVGVLNIRKHSGFKVKIHMK